MSGNNYQFAHYKYHVPLGDCYALRNPSIPKEAEAVDVQIFPNESQCTQDFCTVTAYELWMTTKNTGIQ